MTLVVFDPDARKEFLKAVQFYENCQKGLGQRFRIAIETSIEKISNNPFMYRILKVPFRRILLSKFPYAIIYSIEPDHIRIIAIAHTKRKPEYFLK